MKRFGLDVALIRILLVSVPFSCGPRTFYEPPPQATCGAENIVRYDWTNSPPDGGNLDGGGRPDAGSGPSYYLSPAQCGPICGNTSVCSPDVADGGVPIVRCASDCGGYGVGCGRRPAELPTLAQGSGDALAGYFEQAAYLEAASVQAFSRLGAELRAHGAPEPLIAAAERAAADEVRHTRMMSRLARRHGGTPRRPPPGPQKLRPLAEVARENAEEGCVRETYGALIAWVQAAAAADPQVRRAFRRIAAEETEHAQLAWSVAKWSQSRLTSAERQSIHQAQRQAVAQLTQEVEIEPAAALVTRAGLPTREMARRLVSEAERTLWS